MLYEEDVILHGSTIADSEGLLHGKTKKAVGDLFNKDDKENITKSEVVKDGLNPSSSKGSIHKGSIRKKGSIHKGYDATVRALKGLVK